MSNDFRGMLLEAAGDALYKENIVRWVLDRDETSVHVITVDNRCFVLTIEEAEIS